MRAHLVALLIAGAIIYPAASSAQSAAPQRRTPRIPLIVALVAKLPHPDATSEVVRRANGPDRDIVLLPETAGVEEFSDAIRAVLTARYAAGDSASEHAILRIRRGPGIDLRPVFPWARRVLADARNAPTHNLPGIGPARTMRIWLPAQHRRGRPGH